MKSARQIEVTAIGSRDYGILVDGVLWCFAKHEPRGMHGASYTLRYHAKSEPIMERIERRSSPVVLWSDKHWLSSIGCYGRPDMARREAIHAGKYKTIQERIAETAARLIKKGVIVSPAEFSRRAQIARVAQQRRTEQAEAEDRKKLDDKAHEVVTSICVFGRGSFTLDKATRDCAGTLIMDAMKWARSHT